MPSGAQGARRLAPVAGRKCLYHPPPWFTLSVMSFKDLVYPVLS
jgi:hypothetical protein